MNVGNLLLGLAGLAVILFGLYMIDDWNTREDYIDRCIVKNYTSANGFPPDLRSFCTSSWRLR